MQFLGEDSACPADCKTRLLTMPSRVACGSSEVYSRAFDSLISPRMRDSFHLPALASQDKWICTRRPGVESSLLSANLKDIE